MANDDLKRKIQMGKDKILLFRRLKDAEEKDATKMLFQTEHTFSFSRELDKILTKDGTLVKVGELESEVTGIEAVQSKDDPAIGILQDAVLNGEKIELWEVVVDEDLKENDKYPAIYAQGYLGEWENPANVEDEVRISADFQIEMEPQFGTTALSESQEDAVQYAFREIEKYIEEPNG